MARALIKDEKDPSIDSYYLGTWRSRKVSIPGTFWILFWNHFSQSKIDEQIDAESEAQQIMEIEKQMMRKQTCISIISGIVSNEKIEFSEKGGCTRIIRFPP